MADKGGNGGHPAELLNAAEQKNKITQDLLAIATEVLKDFRSWAGNEFPDVDVVQLKAIVDRIQVGQIKVKVTGEDLRKGKVPKLALNFPDLNLIKINQDLWDLWKSKRNVVKAIFLHECLPFRKNVADQFEIQDYENSSVYYLALKKREQKTKASSVSNSLSTSSQAPVILYEQSFKNIKEGREGMSWLQTKEICESYRKMFEQKYFFVYCTFLQKNWKEIEYSMGSYSDSRFLGYVTNTMSSSGTAAAYLQTSRVRAGAYAHSSMTTSQQTPVIQTVNVPYQIATTVAYQVYGLRVMGWGIFGKNAPWSKLISSESFYDGMYNETFDTQESAEDACYSLIAEAMADKDPRYFRAQCVVVQKSGKFIYQIKTQNPLIN